MNTSNQYQSRLGTIAPIAATIVRKLENPALNPSARDKARNVVSGGAFGADEWIRDARKKTERETAKRVAPRECSRGGKSKLKHGKAGTVLTSHDRDDVSQTIALVLSKHNMLDKAAWIMGDIPKAVWLEMFSECRIALRLNRKMEQGAIHFEAYPTADFLELDNDHSKYLTRDRAAIARNARFYRDALKAARDLEKRQGNRKWSVNYKRMRGFLMASLSSTLNGNGWADLIPDLDPQKGKEYRANMVRRFRNYVLQGVEEITPAPSFIATPSKPEKPAPYYSLADIPDFLG